MPSTENNRVLLEIKDTVAYVTMNRADKHNGLDWPMVQQMISTAKSIRRNRDIRVVILSGKGPSFCAGLDFSAVAKQPMLVPKLFLKWPFGKMNAAQRIAHIWRDLPIPVIAVIHGNCFGGGTQIALASDFRIARPDANLSILEMKWGLIPDMTGMVTLSRLTRLDIAQELTMTGRFFSGTEAAGYGLVTRLADDPMADAEMLAGQIAQQSPDAVAAAKYLFRKTWKKDTWATLLWERWVQARLLGRKNQRIAMANGMKKDGDKKPFVRRRSFR
ncbi:Short-chain-enoyl-CoA hydratase [BD1-7 clade bacterium]|uniref:Short-chain-enoyl-CoA hydratase n=1 Tax=BD1-7 clade bacterium TaxID=2029982 RepID=A0A5S9Q5A9_9GAMM|nr:Short-chain-enoyl-CoA hydratase [BD1-7 clade bacterium]CAA0112559.1 Short-chain-enoyl-CoA hydratase [BD1-7 clade bacterium]